MILCEVLGINCLFVNVDTEIGLYSEGRRSPRFSKRSDVELVAGSGRHNVDGSPRPGKELTKMLIYLTDILVSLECLHLFCVLELIFVLWNERVSFCSITRKG